MAKKVNISLDDELLKRIDDFADTNYLTRSGLVTVAVSQYLLQREALAAVKQMSISFKRIADSGKFDEESVSELAEFTKFADYFIKNS